MRVSARNVLKGTITRITAGAVNAEVVLEVGPGVEVASIITNASVQRLKLKVGAAAYAVIKASDVLVGVDDDI
jgi:molybdopterin-binding protein